jgi:hypothetical protein
LVIIEQFHRGSQSGGIGGILRFAPRQAKHTNVDRKGHESKQDRKEHGGQNDNNAAALIACGPGAMSRHQGVSESKELGPRRGGHWSECAGGNGIGCWWEGKTSAKRTVRSEESL